MIITRLNSQVQSQEQHLNSFGWHTTSAYDVDETIYVGDTVYFYDDIADEYRWGTYCGFYQDFGLDSDTSPYWDEAADEIDRVVIQETILNPDGHYTLRRDYILPENVTNNHHDIGIIAEWVA